MFTTEIYSTNGKLTLREKRTLFLHLCRKYLCRSPDILSMWMYMVLECRNSVTVIRAVEATPNVLLTLAEVGRSLHPHQGIPAEEGNRSTNIISPPQPPPFTILATSHRSHLPHLSTPLSHTYTHTHTLTHTDTQRCTHCTTHTRGHAASKST